MHHIKRTETCAGGCELTFLPFESLLHLLLQPAEPVTVLTRVARRRQVKVPAALPPVGHVISLISDDEDDADPPLSEGSWVRQDVLAGGRDVRKKLRSRSGSSPSNPRAIDLTEESD